MVLFSMGGLILVDDLEWAKVKPYSLVAVAFLGTIYTNIRTLQYANVETFIVFRASTPILVSVFDWIFLGRELPGFQSSLCLLGKSNTTTQQHGSTSTTYLFMSYGLCCCMCCCYVLLLCVVVTCCCYVLLL